MGYVFSTHCTISPTNNRPLEPNARSSHALGIHCKLAMVCKISSDPIPEQDGFIQGEACFEPY